MLKKVWNTVVIAAVLGLVTAVPMVPVQAYYKDNPKAVEKKAKPPKAYESIELIEGDANKPYVKVGLVWQMHNKADKAVKKLKKRAYMMGGDAVIHYVIQAPSVFGWAVRWSTPEEAAQAKAAEEIPTIFGKPARGYEEIGPVWYSHDDANKALKKLKKIARKKGADAIIEFKIGSYEGVRYSKNRNFVPKRWNTNGLLAWNDYNTSNTQPMSTGVFNDWALDKVYNDQQQMFKTDTNNQISVPVRYTVPTLQGIAVKWKQ